MEAITMRWPVTSATGLLTCFLACLAFPRPALADEQGGDIAGSYALLNAIGYGNDYPKGWLASGAVYLSNFLGVAGEVGGRATATAHTLASLRSVFRN